MTKNSFMYFSISSILTELFELLRIGSSLNRIEKAIHLYIITKTSALIFVVPNFQLGRSIDKTYCAL